MKFLYLLFVLGVILVFCGCSKQPDKKKIAFIKNNIENCSDIDSLEKVFQILEIQEVSNIFTLIIRYGFKDRESISVVLDEIKTVYPGIEKVDSLKSEILWDNKSPESTDKNTINLACSTAKFFHEDFIINYEKRFSPETTAYTYYKHYYETLKTKEGMLTNIFVYLLLPWIILSLLVFTLHEIGISLNFVPKYLLKIIRLPAKLLILLYKGIMESFNTLPDLSKPKIALSNSGSTNPSIFSGHEELDYAEETETLKKRLQELETINATDDATIRIVFKEFSNQLVDQKEAIFHKMHQNHQFLLDKMNNSEQSKSNEISDLNSQILKLNAIINELQDSIQTQQANDKQIIEEIDEKIKTLKKYSGKENLDLKNLHEDLRKWISKLEGNGEKIRFLESFLSTKITEIQNQEIKNITELKSEFHQKLNALEKSVISSSEKENPDLVALKEQIKQLFIKNEKLHIDIEQSNQAKFEDNPAYLGLIEQIDGLKAKNKELFGIVSQFTNARIDDNPIYKSLKDQLDSLTAKNKELSGIVDQFNIKLEENPIYQGLKKELDELARKNKELYEIVTQTSNAKLENNPAYLGLIEQLEELNTKNKKLSDFVEQFKSNPEENLIYLSLKEQLDSMATQNKELSGIVNQFANAYIDDNPIFLKINERLDKLASHTVELSEDMKQFATDKLENNPEIISLKEEIANITQESETIKQKLNLFEENKIGEKPALAEVKTLVENLTSQSSNLTQKLDQLENGKKEDDLKFTEYRNTIADLLRKNELLTHSVQELENQSKAQNPELKQLNEQLVKKINELEQDFENVKQQSKSSLSEEAIIEIIRDEGISRSDAVQLIRKELSNLTHQESRQPMLTPDVQLGKQARSSNTETSAKVKKELTVNRLSGENDFFSIAPKRGIFYERQLKPEIKKKETVYKITIDSSDRNKATYELVKDGETLRIALNIPDDYILPAFDVIGDGKLTDAKEIQITNPGKLEKDENKNWKIVEKGILKFN